MVWQNFNSCRYGTRSSTVWKRMARKVLRVHYEVILWENGIRDGTEVSGSLNDELFKRRCQRKKKVQKRIAIF